MLSRRGYSLTMWTVVFGVVISTLAIFLMPTKRAITSKVLRLSDHLLWGYWGDAVRQDGGNNKSQIGEATSNSSMTAVSKHLEQDGIITIKDTMESSTTSSHSSY